MNEGTVSVSYIKGTVTGGSDVGGLVGNNDGTVTQSYSTGSMGGAAQSTRVGGLAGFNQGHGRIATSYSTSKVSGESETGGLVGQNKGAVIGCYATGTVAGVAGGSGTGAGGLVGFHPLGSITASYSTGAVSGPSAAGGLVGAKVAEATVTSSYWDTESSGQSTSSGGVGKSTSELQGPLDYTGIYANWNIDVDNAPSTGVDEPWDFDTGTSYPRLHNDRDPAAPNGLTAVPKGAASLLTWNGPVDTSITAYQVRRKEGTGEFGAWSDIPLSGPGGKHATSYGVTGLTPATIYTFQVRAVNSMAIARSRTV